VSGKRGATRLGFAVLLKFYRQYGRCPRAGRSAARRASSLPRRAGATDRRSRSAALLHRPEHVAHAQQQLINLFQDLLTEVAAISGLRDDVPSEELGSYCLHALSAAGNLPSEPAVRRLATVTLAGLRSSH
jgi:hypothetical protein